MASTSEQARAHLSAQRPGRQFAEEVCRSRGKAMCHPAIGVRPRASAAFYSGSSRFCQSVPVVPRRYERWKPGAVQLTSCRMKCASGSVFPLGARCISQAATSQSRRVIAMLSPSRRSPGVRLSESCRSTGVGCSSWTNLGARKSWRLGSGPFSTRRCCRASAAFARQRGIDHRGDILIGQHALHELAVDEEIGRADDAKRPAAVLHPLQPVDHRLVL